MAREKGIVPALFIAALIAAALISSWVSTGSRNTHLEHELHGTALPSSKNEGHPPSTSRVEAHAEKPAAKKAEPAPAPMPVEKPAARAESEKTETSSWVSGGNLVDWLTAVATLLIAFFAWGLKDSTAKLRDSIDRMLWESQDTTRRRARAYLTITPTLRLAGESKEVALEIRNVGQSPAYNVTTAGGKWVDNFPEAGPLPHLPMQSTQYCIAPGEAVNVYEECDLSAADLKRVAKGKKAFWAAMEVKYTDIFGDRWRTFVKLRLTDFETGESGSRPVPTEIYEAS